MQETMFTDALCEAMTSKRSFLKTIDSLIPWEDWISKIQPVYYEGRIGQKPYPIELVLRMYVLQNLYDLSDMGVMTEVIDSRAFSWFCGITSPADVPDGDTVGRFRNLLIKNDILNIGTGRQIMEEKVLDLLSKVYPEIDFTSSEKLVDDAVLDSITITGIIAALSVEFGINIPYEEIVEENFNSVGSLAAMVERLQSL